jgi:hypothetical protein
VLVGEWRIAPVGWRAGWHGPEFKARSIAAAHRAWTLTFGAPVTSGMIEPCSLAQHESDVRPATTKRIILDTNLWSEIGKEDTGPEFASVLRDIGNTVVLPPSLLAEVMQTPEAGRRRRVEAMWSTRGIRLRAEADLCTDELCAALQRGRPNWLRAKPDSAATERWRRLWTKRHWMSARYESEKFHQQMLTRPSAAAAAAWFEAQLSNRQSMMDAGVSGDFIDLHMRCSPEESIHLIGGWDGSRTAAWRVQIGDYYWQVLTRGAANDTERQWLAAYLNIGSAIANASDYRQLWFEELQPADISRQWLRFAVGHTQLSRKVKKSNALDAQHSTYLVDADLFLSGDQAFVAALQEVRRQAPFAFAEPRLIKRGGSWADSIIAALTTRPTGTKATLTRRLRRTSHLLHSGLGMATLRQDVLKWAVWILRARGLRARAAACPLTRLFPATVRAEVDAESGAHLPAGGRHTPSAPPLHAPEPRSASSRFPGSPRQSSGQ